MIFNLAVLLLVPIVLCLFAAMIVGLFLMKQQYSTTVVDEIEFNDLPRRLRDKIEQVEHSYPQLGFVQKSHFKVARRGITMFSRAYLSGDCTVLAEITSTRLFGFFDQRSIEFTMTSALDDGTLLQTSSHNNLPGFLADLKATTHRIALKATATKDPMEMSGHHEQFILDSIAGRQLLPLSFDLMPAMQDYALNLLDAYLHEKGVLPDSPFRNNEVESDDVEDGRLSQAMDLLV